MARQEELRIQYSNTTITREVFSEADRNKDGGISADELQAIISYDIPLEEIQILHRSADNNHDGHLDPSEFRDLLNDPKNAHYFERYLDRYVKFIVPPNTRRQHQRNGLSEHRTEVNGFSASDQIDGTGSYEEQYTCIPPPFGMISVSCLEMLFYFLNESSMASSKVLTGDFAKMLCYDPTKRYEFWRFFTYMFVHANNMHLATNLIAQILFGIPLEMVHRWWRVLGVYIFGVTAGSLATSIVTPTVKLVGASGGVYSLLTAHIATIIMNWKEMAYPIFQLLFVLCLIGSDVGNSIYMHYNKMSDGNIGHVAHLAGAITGLLVGIAFLKNLKLNFTENLLWWMAVAMYVALMLVGIFWHIFDPYHFPEQT